MNPAHEEFFRSVQKSCLPGIWSRGVALARDQEVLGDSLTDDELVFRVRVRGQTVSPKVTLWPLDEDYFCDCGDKIEPCAHVAAAIVATKNGQVKSASQLTPDVTTSLTPSLHYRLTRKDGELFFDRYLVAGESEEVLGESLVSYIGGVQSGRIKARAVAATKADLGVDSALISRKRGVLEAATMAKLLARLEECANITLDGLPVTASSRAVVVKAQVVDDAQGFKIRKVTEPTADEVFKNGVALCGSVLKPFESVALEERVFSTRDAVVFVSEVLPALEKKIYVDVQTTRLPRVVKSAPRIVLQLQRLEGEILAVTPRLLYGNPPMAEIHGDRLQLLGSSDIPQRDIAAENFLVRKLQAELFLKPDQITKFQGQMAVDFTRRAEGWDRAGDAVKTFSVAGKLEPKLHVTENGFDLKFLVGSSQADASQVMQAWRQNESYVALLGGGYAPLPKDWLARYGERIAELMSAKTAKGGLPRYHLPELLNLSQELGEPLSHPLQKFKEQLENFSGIAEAKLPKDLKATPRHYQQQGINWLCFLRDSGMGAMLADDMGLGKTLQALCAIQGRTLVVAPTSVLYNWTTHLEKFRPALSYSLYYGANRKLDLTKDITITTYAVLRLDREALSQTHWDTIIVDEAQTIKNPDSQVARAVFGLQGDFRIALSGTPIENKLEDLWSQFQFLNPGLLGTREAFQEEFAGGDADSSRRLRARIKPFLLRRLKKEVAPELPPRTETVLQCELANNERDVYDAILAATRKEVLEQLDAGGGVFAALEALLRLRQACCHLSLVPGQKAESSSKIELLLETLEESIALGHRALVFSQWTSYLDLIEPALTKHGITHLRLDGSTTNRNEVIEEFQNSSGPSVLLISLKAGGVGLTLTAADHIFIMDPWWNPAVEDQAADRAHRIGQKNPVLIHRLVAKDTLEERILELQQKKLQIAASVLQDSAASLALTKEDILDLFR